MLDQEKGDVLNLGGECKEKFLNDLRSLYFGQ